MTITYKWGLQCPPIVVPSKDGLTNVVQTVHWTYTATDGDISLPSIGCTSLDAPDPTKFIAFDALTLETVIGWIEEVLGTEAVEKMQASLAAQIASLRDPNRPRPLPLVAS